MIKLKSIYKFIDICLHSLKLDFIVSTHKEYKCGNSRGVDKIKCIIITALLLRSGAKVTAAAQVPCILKAFQGGKSRLFNHHADIIK